jgi:hypothetical protein
MLVTRDTFALGGASLLRAPVGVPAAERPGPGGGSARVVGLDASALHACVQTTVSRDRGSEVLTLQSVDTGGALAGPAYSADRDDESGFGERAEYASRAARKQRHTPDAVAGVVGAPIS